MALNFDEARAVRKSMSWLHTWSGLLTGWLLFAIFVTGTLAYYRTEITHWMQPELHVARHDDRALALALQRLQQVGEGARSWGIDLPNPRNPSLQITWSNSDRRGDATREVLDPGTGEVLKPRSTAGGRFLFDFHYHLHGVDRGTGQMITGIVAMGMLLAVITGIVVHKNIFKDFFTFRPGKGQRSWLDAHNVSSVLALPFMLVIGASGVMLTATQVMPAVTGAAYDWDSRGMAMDIRGRRPGQPNAQQAGPAGQAGAGRAPVQGQQENRGGGRGGQGARGDNQGGSRPNDPALAPAPMTDVAALFARAIQEWPERGVAGLTIRQPGTALSVIDFRSVGGELLTNRGMPQTQRFSAVSGVPLSSEPAPVSVPRAFFAGLEAMHIGVFAVPFSRVLLFVSGVLGCVMVATGMSLWLVARQRERLGSGRQPGHRLVEVLNVGLMGGVLLAAVAYFWANRLLPAELPGRQDWEVNAFFIAWLVGLVHAILRPHRRAWVEQLVLAGAAAALLPVLNGLTGGAHLGVAFGRGQFVAAGFDLTALVLGLSLLWGARVVHRHAAKRPAKRAAPAPKARPSPESVALPDTLRTGDVS